MTLKDTLAALEQAGTAQNRKIYGRHGVAGPQYGVSFAELKKLKKTIGTDQPLARRPLGHRQPRRPHPGRHGGRSGGLRLPRAGRLGPGPGQLRGDRRLQRPGGPQPPRPAKVRAWRDRKAEHVSACAFNVLAMLALHEGEGPDEAWLGEQLAVIAAEIHTRPNRTRHSMNQALIAIGARGGALEKAAIAAAKRMGKVEVDHGQTSCQTPDAVAYIAKTRAHRRAKGAK